MDIFAQQSIATWVKDLNVPLPGPAVFLSYGGNNNIAINNKKKIPPFSSAAPNISGH